MSVVSFLPYNEHPSQQAPYQYIMKSEYVTLLSLMPEKIDWTLLTEYEKEDSTKSSQTFACTGDVCEMVDIT